MQRQKGLVLFEALVTLVIASPFLAVLVSSVHHSLLLYSKLKIEAESHKNLLKLRALYSEAMNSLDTQTLKLPLVKHSDGRIKFTDGSINPVVNAAAGRAPDSRSDAISVLELQPIYALKVVKRELLGSSALFFACLKFNGDTLSQHPPKPPMLEREGFLGLSLNGKFELSGEVRRWISDTQGDGCYSLTLRKNKSMSVPDLSISAIHNVTLLIPILRSYTLYLDREGNIRYLGHRGGENIENQPLLDGIKSIRLALTSIPGLNTYHLRARVETALKRSEELNFIQQLSLDQSLNILLN